MKYFSLISILFFLTLTSFSQITSDRQSPAWSKDNSLNTNEPALEIPKPNLKLIHQEDKTEEKNTPWRFGVHIPVSFNSVEDGNWESNSGWSRWSLTIKSRDALSINLNFDKFHLPTQAELIVYNQNSEAIIEAITANNNKSDSLFSIRPILGEEIRLELMVPNTEKHLVVLGISGVVYGYRNLYQKLNKTFNSSGGCNVNINCPEGDKWQNIKRSVAMILASNNSRFCTGTLVNNVRQDSTPYFLTAAHCPVMNNSIVIFDYESPNCNPNTDGSLLKSISGNTLKAVATRNDFRLLELSTTPPASYNVFYAGWNAQGNKPFEATCIHHPRGDVKKISYDEDTLRSARYLGGPLDTHWEVNNWEVGTTESGSSGSSLFDNKRRIIGQLQGGSANCGNNAADYYGKFSESWDFSSTSSQQLKIWLDPDLTNTLVLDGLDPIGKANNLDIELTSIDGLKRFTCDSTTNPIILITNNGNNTIDSILVDYGTNNSFTQLYKWVGTLMTDQTIELSLPSLSIDSNDTSVVVRAIPLLGVDQDLSNNQLKKTIIVNDTPQGITLTLRTDQFGNELTWSIIDSNSRILYKGGPYQELPNTSTGKIYIENYCLYNGCFSFNLYDAYGDGFTGPFGNGYVLIQDSKLDTLLFYNNFTTDKRSDTFCVNNLISSISERNVEASLRIFPNPINRGDRLKIGSLKNNYIVRLHDIKGRELLSSTNKLNIMIPEEFSPGMYILLIYEDNIVVSRNKLIVQ